jgi:hypothetical protein
MAGAFFRSQPLVQMPPRDATASDNFRSGTQPRRRRGGMFGGRAQGIIRREDGDPGTLANYFLFGLNGVNDMRADRRDRDLFGFQVRRAKQQESATEQELQRQQQMEEAISQLPPEQQAYARLDPEAFIEAMIQQQVGGGWETGQGYSHAFRTNPDGTVTLGDQLPLRPRAPIQGYVMPNDGDDWEYADD